MSKPKIQPKKPSKAKSIQKKLKPLKLSPLEASEFPETAPILSPEQMFCGDYANSHSRPTKCCLLGHANLWAVGNPWTKVEDFIFHGNHIEALRKASEYILGKEIIYDCCEMIDEINDVGCPKFSKLSGVPVSTLQARIWNLGMALLGYVVGNPEAKHVDCS